VRSFAGLLIEFSLRVSARDLEGARGVAKLIANHRDFQRLSAKMQAKISHFLSVPPSSP
jgi:hypothetical protein